MWRARLRHVANSWACRLLLLAPTSPLLGAQQHRTCQQRSGWPSGGSAEQ